jgi:hypothetical protein
MPYELASKITAVTSRDSELDEGTIIISLCAVLATAP